MIEMLAQKSFVGALGLALAFLLGVILKSLMPYRMNLIEVQGKRIDKLEKALESERAVNSAEIALLRHRVNNAEQALDLFIELIEANPSRAAEHAARIKSKRERDRSVMSQESATIRAAQIIKTQPDQGDDE